MKACVFTIGCKLNEVESASLMRGLEERGFSVSDGLGYADVYLLNTCAVTAEAERKSRQAVSRMRKFNAAAPIIVFGCASQHDRHAFEEKEGVKVVAGAMCKDRVLTLLDGFLAGGHAENADMLPTESVFCELPVPARTKTRVYLRVQDGCNRFCSYCLIPYLRGRSRSRGLAGAVREAMECGAKEIVLTGIDLSSYRDGESDLGDLLLALKDVPARIRLGSLETGIVTDAFLEKAQKMPNFAPHFHLSLQSGSTRVLKSMNRRYTREEYLAACRKIYAAFPSAAITTDIIVGFPTEEERDFCDSLSIVEEAGFARVHAFPFSAREGTQAAKLKDLPPAVKKERMERMLERCEQAEMSYVSRFLGKTLTALFEEDGGYTENYIRVFHETAKEGTMYEVRLTEPCKGGAKCELIKKL